MPISEQSSNTLNNFFKDVENFFGPNGDEETSVSLLSAFYLKANNKKINVTPDIYGKIEKTVKIFNKKSPKMMIILKMIKPDDFYQWAVTKSKLGREDLESGSIFDQYFNKI